MTHAPHSAADPGDHDGAPFRIVVNDKMPAGTAALVTVPLVEVVSWIGMTVTVRYRPEHIAIIRGLSTKAVTHDER